MRAEMRQPGSPQQFYTLRFPCAAAGFKYEQVDLHVFIRYQDQIYTFYEMVWTTWRHM